MHRPLKCCVPIALVLGAGCSRDAAAPTTYAANGIVRFSTGQPFPGGIISLTSTADPRDVVDAPIGDDGSFSLGMVFQNRRIDGAPAGTYDVLVSSRFVAGKGVQTFALPKPVIIRGPTQELLIVVDAGKPLP